MNFSNLFQRLWNKDFTKLMAIISFITFVGSAFIYIISFIYSLVFGLYFDIPFKFNNISNYIFIPILAFAFGFTSIIFVIKIIVDQIHNLSKRKKIFRILLFIPLLLAALASVILMFIILLIIFNSIYSIISGRNVSNNIVFFILLAVAYLLVYLLRKIDLKKITIIAIAIFTLTMFIIFEANSTTYNKTFNTITLQDTLTSQEEDYVELTTYHDYYYVCRCEIDLQSKSIIIDKSNYILVPFDNKKIVRQKFDQVKFGSIK
jgi:hypothetical protein